MSEADLDRIAPFDLSHEYSSSRAIKSLGSSGKTATSQYYSLNQSIRKYGTWQARRMKAK
ncbi:MAG TPA: hypothetical protein VGC14_02015 [Rhizobium sp.]